VAGPGADTPPADVTATVQADGAVTSGAVTSGAVVNGLAVSGGPDGVVAAMLACAEAFLGLQAEAGVAAWRIADLPGGADQVRAAVAGRLGLAAAPIVSAAAAAAAPPPRPVGLVTGHRRGTGELRGTRERRVTRGRSRDGGESAATVRDDPEDSVVLLAPLGRLTAAQLSWVADRLAEQPARVTPWRSIVLPRVAGAAGVLRAAAGPGFGTSARSPWLRVTACAGRPGCASALADVQADAAAMGARWPGRLVHVSGCGRHCGRPAGCEIDVTATSEGYQVAGA
jgi:precorrin-3B synthase